LTSVRERRMSHTCKTRWWVAVTVTLIAMAGCGSIPFFGGGAVTAGPYKVVVTDALTGTGISDVMIGWDYYFTSATVDPAQRPNLGVSVTDAEGVALIPGAQHPGGDRFEELTLEVTVAGYLEVKKTVRSRSGTIKLELIPVGRMNP